MSVNAPHNQLGRPDLPARRDDSSESNSYCRVLLLSLSKDFAAFFPVASQLVLNHRPDVFRPNQRPCLFSSALLPSFVALSYLLSVFIPPVTPSTYVE